MLAAVSPLSAGVVDGPQRPARVLGVFPTALYLGLAGADVLATPADPDGAGIVVVPVVTSDALLLPTAVRLPVSSAVVDWGVAAGDRVPLGGGRVGLSALGGICVVRQWRPARVQRRAVGGSDAGWTPSAAHAFVASRIGCGPGLTPDGDDELCGALLVAHAVTSGPNPLRDSVVRVLGRTTSLSASLLRAAGDGYAVRDLAAYVDAVLDIAARAPLGPKSPEVARLAAAVAAVGHSSGRALLRGVRVGLAHAAPHPTREPACA